MVVTAKRPGAASGEIMFVIGTLHVGGSEQHLARIAPALSSRGWKVSVFSLGGDGPLRLALEREGVAVLRSPVRRGQGGANLLTRVLGFSGAAAALLWAMLRRRPAVVHCFLPAAYMTGAPAAWIARIPIRIMSRRSLNDYQRNRLGSRSLERLLHRSMTALLGNSRAVVRQLSEEGVPPRRLGLIYNGIDACEFEASADSRAATRDALSLAPTTLALVIVANLIQYKGHADLIDALALARPDMLEDWRLIVVGRDDGIQDAIERQAEAAGLAGNIVFLGARRDVPALLAAADIGLLVSHQEGFSNAVIEAMAAGLPMIVTDVGGNAEAVQDKETGLVVPARDPARLAQAIVALANDPNRRSILGAAGRRRALEFFDFAECVDKYDRLYRALLDGKLPQQVDGVAVDGLR